MIWNFVVIGAVVLIFLVLVRRIPAAIEIEKKTKKKEVTPSEVIAQSFIAQADDAFGQKKWETAEELYIKAATQEPNNAKIYERLGEMYLVSHNFYDAKEAFLQVIKIKADDPFAYAELASAYLGLKDYFKACQTSQKALELAPKNKEFQKLNEKAKKFREKEQKRIKR